MFSICIYIKYKINIITETNLRELRRSKHKQSFFGLESAFSRARYGVVKHLNNNKLPVSNFMIYFELRFRRGEVLVSKFYGIWRYIFLCEIQPLPCNLSFFV